MQWPDEPIDFSVWKRVPGTQYSSASRDVETSRSGGETEEHHGQRFHCTSHRTLNPLVLSWISAPIVEATTQSGEHHPALALAHLR